MLRKVETYEELIKTANHCLFFNQRQNIAETYMRTKLK